MYELLRNLGAWAVGLRSALISSSAPSSGQVSHDVSQLNGGTACWEHSPL